MENSTSSDQTNLKKAQSADDGEDYKTPPTPLRCFMGALGAATLSLLTYQLTLAIAATFASKPLTSTNQIAIGISAAVRTLVTGMTALGTGVFGVAALGLAALGIQLIFKIGAEQEAT